MLLNNGHKFEAGRTKPTVVDSNKKTKSKPKDSSKSSATQKIKATIAALREKQTLLKKQIMKIREKKKTIREKVKTYKASLKNK